jgi:pyruvate/2-oxoglutarate dehydrogenase complex dihydrolipoamide dehydrogenase (E3) component
MVIPGATYCEPQIASFGVTEEKAKTQGLKYTSFIFPFVGIGKAVAVDRSEGLGENYRRQRNQGDPGSPCGGERCH